MKRVARFIAGLLLALVLCAAAASALVTTTVTIKDALGSDGSLQTFETRIRHSSDRFERADDGLRLIRSSHPFLLHFGMLALSWTATFAAAFALRRLFGTGVRQTRDLTSQPLPEATDEDGSRARR